MAPLPNGTDLNLNAFYYLILYKPNAFGADGRLLMIPALDDKPAEGAVTIEQQLADSPYIDRMMLVTVSLARPIAAVEPTVEEALKDAWFYVLQTTDSSMSDVRLPGSEPFPGSSVGFPADCVVVKRVLRDVVTSAILAAEGGGLMVLVPLTQARCASIWGVWSEADLGWQNAGMGGIERLVFTGRL